MFLHCGLVTDTQEDNVPHRSPEQLFPAIKRFDITFYPQLDDLKISKVTTLKKLIGVLAKRYMSFEQTRISLWPMTRCAKFCFNEPSGYGEEGLKGCLCTLIILILSPIWWGHVHSFINIPSFEENTNEGNTIHPRIFSAKFGWICFMQCMWFQIKMEMEKKMKMW